MCSESGVHRGSLKLSANKQNLYIPLGIMAKELVRHVESCRRHDDLTNDIIKLELKDAKKKWLCNSFKDLTEEMQLHCRSGR